MTEHSYDDAIANLSEALEVLNRPGEGLGVAWGLQRGQAGWYYLVRARDGIQRLRDDLLKHNRIEGASR